IGICRGSEAVWSNPMSGGATWSLWATAGLSSAGLWGPGAGLWISALSTLVADLFVLRKPLVRVAFNAGQIAVATGVGAMLFQWLGGRGAPPLAPRGGSLHRPPAPAPTLPLVGAVVVDFS